ncbi:hypothetical protein D3C73_1109900 [compost metagenome]
MCFPQIFYRFFDIWLHDINQCRNIGSCYSTSCPDSGQLTKLHFIVKLRVDDLLTVSGRFNELYQLTHRFCNRHEPVFRGNCCQFVPQRRMRQEAGALLIFPGGKDNVTLVRLGLPEQLQQMGMAVQLCTALAIVPPGTLSHLAETAEMQRPGSWAFGGKQQEWHRTDPDGIVAPFHRFSEPGTQIIIRLTGQSHCVP